MGKLSGKFIKSRWIIFIPLSSMIHEEQRNMCVWNATILVLLLCVLMILQGRLPNFKVVSGSKGQAWP
jgi:hypothetical protein